MHSSNFYKLHLRLLTPPPPPPTLDKLLQSMTTNHLPPQLPPAWSWNLPMDLHTRNYFPLQDGEDANCEREHLFEKPLTPSDVGKLNRLVIPKQHAEKHFPLDGDSGEKGLLLSFEDESGKPWRFRYSYWTSSQSYVLTKGWSRFVKEKKLDAGDVVLFERWRSSGDRLYIGWKRRGAVVCIEDGRPAAAAQVGNTGLPWSPVYYAAPQSCPTRPSASSYLYIDAVHQDCLLHAGEKTGMPEKTIAPARTSSTKRLRLFGVNLDCEPNQPESRDSSSLTGSVRALHQTQFFPGDGRPGSSSTSSSSQL